MKDLKVTQIEKSFKGRGHFEITVTVSGTLSEESGLEQEVENHDLKCTTTNTLAIDAYFDTEFDENLENEGRFFESRYDAAEALINEVFRKNEIYSDYEIEGLLTNDEVKELRAEIRKELENE